MTINLHLPTKNETLRPTITVVGVGGAGGNAVNNMIDSELEGVHFVTANTDAQSLDNSLTDRRIQLGVGITQGLGAGASPDVGRAAAEEAIDDIHAAIEGSHMVFITAGMGGGTGTGAAPVVARMAREQGILTVGVVTKPFQFEGTHRMRMAEQGLEELQNYVDTMIVIPNQNLFRVANERTTFADAFRMADEVLHSGVRGVTDLMIMPGLINLDFADVRAVMQEMGKAVMGTGEAEGERRAVEAAEAAISNPLLDDVSMKGARGMIINITGGHDMTLFEVDEAANRVRDEVDPDANIIFGSTFHDNMEGRMRVSVVATGIDARMVENKPSGSLTPDKKLTGSLSSSSFHFGYTGRKEPEKAEYDGYKGFNESREPKKELRESKEYGERKKYEADEGDSSPADHAKRDSKQSMFTKRNEGQAGRRSVAVASDRDADHPEDMMNYQQQDEQAGFSFSEGHDKAAVPHVDLRTYSPPFASREREQGVSVPQELQQNPPRHASGERAAPQREQHSGFAAPQPNHPSQRSFYQVTEDDRKGFAHGENLSPRAEGRAHKSDDESGGSAFGFLQRMAGRALSGRDERSDAEYPAENESVGKKTTHTRVREREDRAPEDSAEDESYLEIPAFLRRQAN